MRKLVVTNLVSLDGYYVGRGGSLDALFEYFNPAYFGDGSFDILNLELLRRAETILLGRTTYSGWNEYWASVPDDPNASETRHEYARIVNPMPKLVVSDSLTAADVAKWGNVRVMTRAAALQEIADLKLQQGGDICVFGSRTMWQGVLAAGLVDELHLTIFPMLAGGGTRLFDSQPGVHLTRLSVRAPEQSGNVMVSYAVSKSTE